ncbi:MAG TPA: sugar ABC transporter permease [Clostridiales bacterium]|nr:sugar ABC transporter permease [Clostridiales bacterium]
MINDVSTQRNSSTRFKKHVRPSDVIVNLLLYIVLIIVALAVIAPIIWIVGSSFNPSSSLMSATAVPKEPTIKHYKNLFTKTKFGNWYLNTLKIALINMVLSVALSVITGYVFSRFDFKGKKPALLSILVLQMFPSFMGMIAIYMLLWQLKLLDSHLGLILVYAAGQIPYNTWLVKGYMASIPKSFDEAAKIDGASNMTIFTKIILPLMKPITGFIALTQFMAPWMDFIFPRLILSSDKKKTLAIGLFDLISGNTNNNFTMFAAGAVLVAVPITLIYVNMQRYLLEGMMAGATKQ